MGQVPISRFAFTQKLEEMIQMKTISVSLKILNSKQNKTALTDLNQTKRILITTEKLIW